MFGSTYFAAASFAGIHASFTRSLGRYATILSSRDSTTVLWSR